MTNIHAKKMRKCPILKTKNLIQRLADGRQTTAIMMKKYITQGTTCRYGELWDYIWICDEETILFSKRIRL